MNKMSKKTLALLLTGVMAASLAGCGGSKATTTDTANDDAAAAEATVETTDTAEEAPVEEASTTIENPLDPSNPTNITIWNYYNGDQQAAFDSLVAEFNNSKGAEEGIIVTSVSQGNVDALADALLESAEGKVGAQDMPTLAAVYAETAFILNNEGQLVDLDPYFTKDELAKYVPSFIEEGRLVDDGPLVIFPVSKSTECFAVNTTDYAAFEAESGIAADSITTYEALVDAAKAYYEYTDALTPDVADDGKALYGRDSVANYVYTAGEQLGHSLFTINDDGTATETFDHDTFKTIWDNYYIPFVKGYFTSVANFRSEDMKTGAILALTGSTSGVSYLPTYVTDANDESHDIDIAVINPLYFASGEQVAVQQGAGYCVTKSTPEQEYAGVEFLKWFTESDRNLSFSASSGYSPVTIDGNDTATIEKNFTSDGSPKSENILKSLLVSADVYVNDKTFTNKPFTGSKSVRDILGTSLEQTALADSQKVAEAMQGGQTREEAIAEYVSDEYFEAWFEQLKADVDAAIAK